MSHLPTERLAALADEPATSAEAAHLAGCTACAHERDVYARLRASAREEDARIGAPLTTWESLAPALRADGIIDTGEWRVTRRPARVSRMLTAAAAVLLAAGGAAVGRATAGGSFGLRVADTGGARTSAPAAALAAYSGDSIRFASAADARAARDRSEQLYQSASLWLARHDSATYAPDTPAAMKQRLAALDAVDRTVREQLDSVPYDPVINSYYLTTQGQREATLRQLSATLPDGARMVSF